jgi:hypothetical protein
LSFEAKMKLWMLIPLAFTLGCIAASARTHSFLGDEVKSPHPSPVQPTQMHFHFHMNLKIVLPVGAAAAVILAIIGWFYNKYKNIRSGLTVEMAKATNENQPSSQLNFQAGEKDEEANE